MDRVNFVLNFAVLISVMIMTTNASYAYLDPGTGSMVVQILAAAFATVIIFFKSAISSIRGIFSKKNNEDDDE